MGHPGGDGEYCAAADPEPTFSAAVVGWHTGDAGSRGSDSGSGSVADVLGVPNHEVSCDRSQRRSVGERTGQRERAGRSPTCMPHSNVGRSRRRKRPPRRVEPAPRASRGAPYPRPVGTAGPEVTRRDPTRNPTRKPARSRRDRRGSAEGTTPDTRAGQSLPRQNAHVSFVTRRSGVRFLSWAPRAAPQPRRCATGAPARHSL